MLIALSIDSKFTQSFTRFMILDDQIYTFLDPEFHMHVCREGVGNLSKKGGRYNEL